jgi:1-phosphofructokinase
MGGIVRAERELAIPSGKGVDASLVLHELGGETVVLGLRAGLNGRLHAGLLEQRGIAHDMVPAEGETRMATILVDLTAQQQSTISAPTLAAGEEQLAGLIKRVRRHAGQAWGLICGGSLPPGLPEDSYARVLRAARACGLVTLLDTSHEALRQGVVGLPDVLKINVRELRDLSRAGTPRAYTVGGGALDGEDLADLAQALAGYLGHWASQAIVITLGERGALAATQEGAYVARPPSVRVVNTAGAGDALDAGLMLARSRGQDWPAALALGTAAAASVVANEGTAICSRDQVHELLDKVRVERLTKDD